MLLLSFILLLLTALLGIILATVHLQGTRRPLRWPVWGPHGLLGLTGFIILLLGLGGPPRGEALGLAQFGRIAAFLFAAALLAGGILLFDRLRRRRLPTLAVGLHATLAIGAVVILAAYTLVG